MSKKASDNIPSLLDGNAYLRVFSKSPVAMKAYEELHCKDTNMLCTLIAKTQVLSNKCGSNPTVFHLKLKLKGLEALENQGLFFVFMNLSS